MHPTLSSVEMPFTFVYHDDIAIFWRTPRRHIYRTRFVLYRLDEAGFSITLKPLTSLELGSINLFILYAQVDLKAQVTQLTLYVTSGHQR